MGLLTLLLLAALTAIYLSKSFEKKPAIVTQVVDKLLLYIDDIAFWGSIYAVVGVLFTLLMPFTSVGMLPRLLANIAIIVMTLPFTIQRIAAKYEGKANPAIVTEAKVWGAWVVKNEKYIGYAGAVIGVILFLAIFK